jgi:protein-S-isoprenylcysteine O-methyltransferase Ste14
MSEASAPSSTGGSTATRSSTGTACASKTGATTRTTRSSSRSTTISADQVVWTNVSPRGRETLRQSLSRSRSGTRRLKSLRAWASRSSTSRTGWPHYGGSFASRANRRRDPRSAGCEPPEHNVAVQKARAAIGTLATLVLAPGVVAGVIPWWLTDWRTEQRYWLPLRVVGVGLIIAGSLVLLEAFARFVVEGLGTPAPIAPTRRLVVGGFYRYVRNPMYLAVVATIVGQALELGQPILLLYAAAVALTVAAFVHWYEEPTLSHQYGREYDEYRRAVPGWWPRRKPWNGGPP